MKRTVIALVILLLIGGLCFFAAGFVENSTEKIEADLTRLETAYRQQDAATCEEIFRSLSKEREQLETFYPFFGYHQPVHELSESLQQIPVWIACGDDSSFYAELIRCRHLTEEMRLAEQLLPENIF